MSPFQQTIAAAIESTRKGDYAGAIRLIESVEYQAESDLFHVLNNVCIRLEMLRQRPEAAALARDVVEDLEPLTKPGARVPDPAGFATTARAILKMIEADTAEAFRKSESLADDLVAFATSSDDRADALTVARKLAFYDGVFRDPSNRDNARFPYAKMVIRDLLTQLLRGAKTAAEPSFRDLIRQTRDIVARLPSATTKAERLKIDKTAWRVFHTTTSMLSNNISVAMPANHAMIDVSNAIHRNEPIDALVPVAVKALDALLDPDLPVPNRPKLHAVLVTALGLMVQDEARAWRKAYEMVRDASVFASAMSQERIAVVTLAADLAFVLGAYEDPSKWANPMFADTKKDAMDAVQKLLRSTKTAGSYEPYVDPRTLEEWRAYVASLSGETLLAKARAANQVAFVRLLEEDGLTPQDIADVLRAFAMRLVEDGQEPPGRTEGSYVDYGMLVYPADLNVESEPE